MIEILIDKPIDEVWNTYTNTEDVLQWNQASEDWHTTNAENNLEIDGQFIYRMEAKDKSFGFNLIGTYCKIIAHEYLEYHLEDGRNVKVLFEKQDDKSKITQVFEPENTNPLDLQEQGWLAILKSFKTYIERY